MNNDKYKFIKKQIFLTMVLFVVKIIGFVKQIILAAVFGTTFEVDVYNLSSGFVGGIAQMIFGAISVAILPIYAKCIVEKGRDESSRYITKIIKFSVILATILSILICLSAPIISKLITNGYSSEQLGLVTIDIRIFSLSVFFFALSNIYMIILDVEKEFIPYRISGIINSISFIAVALLIGEKYGGNALVIAALISWGLQLANIYVFSRKYYVFKFKEVQLRKIWEDEEIKEIWGLALPMLIGNAIIEINDLVDKTISTGLTIGALTSLSYAQILKEFVVFIFVTSLSSVIFSYTSMYIAKGRNDEVSKLINKSIRILIILLVPITIYIFLYSRDIVSVAFMRGAFNQKAVALCSLSLRGYSLGFVFIGIRECINKTHYSYQDTKHPLFNGAVAVSVNIVCSIILSRRIGVAGISAATSISAFLSCILSLNSIKKHNNNICISQTSKFLAQIFVSLVLTFIISSLMINVVQQGFVRLLLGLLVVFLPYFVFLILLGNQEMIYLLEMLSPKKRKKS